jgi:hypothetical protein
MCFCSTKGFYAHDPDDATAAPDGVTFHAIGM